MPIIIAGHVAVAADKRDTYVAAHADLVRRAREAPGCLDFAISADPLDPGRVNTFERWESREHLGAWRRVARARRTGIRIRGGRVAEYPVEAEVPVFG